MKLETKKLVIGLLFCITLKSYGQPVGSTFFVTTYYDGIINANNPAPVGYNPASFSGTSCPNPPCYYTIRDAINWANTYTGPGPITIDINTHNQVAGYIVLFQNLPPISLSNNIDLTIVADKLLFYGFKVYEGLNNNLTGYGIYSPVSRCFEINTNYSGSNLSTVTLSNLVFSRWNTALITVNSYYDPVFAPCIIADDCQGVTITDCDFNGYATGVVYSNNIGHMTISNCDFNPFFETPKYWYAGYNPPYGNIVPPGQNPASIVNPLTFLITTNWNACFSTAISLSANHILAPTGSPSSYVSTITGNQIINSPVSDTEYGVGIVVDPADVWNPSLNMLGLYNVRADITISGNTINDLAYGIGQGFVPPLQSQPDITYKLKIDGNTINTRVTNLTYQAPYKHFLLTNNNFGHNYDQTKFWQHPQSIHFGGGMAVQNAGYLNIFSMQPQNQFGFEINDDPSTPSLNKNNTNTFSSIPNYPNVHPLIGTEGNFGPLNVTNNKGLNFVNFNYPGFIQVGTGQGTSLSRCVLKSSTSLYTSPIPPIHFYDGYSNVNPAQYIPPNKNIPSPTILAAYITTLVSGMQQVQIHYSLNGSFFTTGSNNGPFKVEFFKSNDKSDPNPAISNQYGDLTDFLYLDTHSSDGTYIATFSPPAGTSFTYGDRIGVTVTAEGNSSNSTSSAGTSKVSYFQLLDCPKCLGDFSPEPGKKYLLSGWCRIPYIHGPVTYNFAPGYPTPVLQVLFYSAYLPPVQMGSTLVFKPSGPIIDGWQKIEGIVDIPANAKGIKIQAFNDIVTNGVAALTFGEMHFDDIRFHPLDASMKSYVYDSDYRRFSAELDENNYATFYEYDEDGKLVRVKKETEKGVMTIKESRNSQPIR